MTFIKSTLVLAATLCTLVPATVHAEGLDAAQREKLAKQLEKLINKSEATLSSRQATAYNAYKGAIGSNNAAFDLYLNCVEKVDFLDAGKKSSNFRDWKRDNKDKLADPGFRLALRHQLNWLVLTIEASRSDDPSYSSFSPKARAAIQSIFEDAKTLEGHQDILKQSVLSSVFSQAYGFGSFQVNNWPTSPLQLSEVYEKVILPELRSGKEAKNLRSAWLERIKYEELSYEYWAQKPEGSIGMKKNVSSPELTKFIKNERPKLIWSMEKEVFKAGDEYGAASRMLTHISKNLSHNEAANWAKELQELLQPEKKQKPKLSEETSEESNEKKQQGKFIELKID